MRVTIAHHRSIADLKERFTLFAQHVEGTEDAPEGRIQGPLLSPIERGGAIHFEVPERIAEGHGMVFAVHCLSNHPGITALKAGPGWSILVAPDGGAPERELDFPLDPRGMRVTIHGGRVLASAFRDPALDTQGGDEPLLALSSAYRQLIADGALERPEQGGAPIPPPVDDDDDGPSPGR